MIENFVEWPLERLDERGKFLVAHKEIIRHNPERLKQIEMELSLIATELWCRHRDGELEIVKSPA